VAPEQQPAVSSLASEASMHRLAELTQPKAVTEPADSSTLASRCSNPALASLPASAFGSAQSAHEDALSRAPSEPGAAEGDARSGGALITLLMNHHNK